MSEAQEPIIGKIYPNTTLTVLSFLEEQGKSLVEVKCICGTQFITTKYRLQNGKSIRCFQCGVKARVKTRIKNNRNKLPLSEQVLYETIKEELILNDINKQFNRTKRFVQQSKHTMTHKNVARKLSVSLSLVEAVDNIRKNETIESAIKDSVIDIASAFRLLKKIKRLHGKEEKIIKDILYNRLVTDEADLEFQFCKFLDSANITYKSQVNLPEIGTADVITDDAIYELKFHTGNNKSTYKGSIWSGIGQLFIYQQSLGKDFNLVLVINKECYMVMGKKLIDAVRRLNISFLIWDNNTFVDETIYLRNVTAR